MSSIYWCVSVMSNWKTPNHNNKKKEDNNGWKTSKKINAFVAALDINSDSETSCCSKRKIKMSPTFCKKLKKSDCKSLMTKRKFAQIENSNNY